MAQMQVADFTDLLKATLPELNEPNYTDLSVDEVDFPAAKILMQNQKKVKAGTSYDWRINTTDGDSARNVAVSEHDNVNIQDGLVTATAPWRKSMTSYAFYEEEMMVNQTPRRIVDLIKLKESRAMTAWTKLLESNFWAFPSASDTTTPYGVPYWVTKNSTVGFSGGIPSGYSSVAGVSPTTYAGWNNYSGNYVAVTQDDLIRKARTMAVATGFKPPVAIPSTNTGDKIGWWTNLSVRQTMEDLADARNDDLGTDLAKNDESVMLRRGKINYAPKLDSDTTQPLYQLNFGVFKVVSMMWMRRKVIGPYPGQRNVTAVFLDSLYQIVCMNRRLLGVLATGTTYPS